MRTNVLAFLSAMEKAIQYTQKPNMKHKHTKPIFAGVKIDEYLLRKCKWEKGMKKGYTDTHCMVASLLRQ